MNWAYERRSSIQARLRGIDRDLSIDEDDRDRLYARFPDVNVLVRQLPLDADGTGELVGGRAWFN
jgi:hypothetical protein